MQRKFGDMVLGIEKFPTAYATDASWLVIFFDPNKSVEYLSIPNDHIRGHGANHASNEEWPICKSRSDAIFMLTEIESQNGQKTTGITLTTKNHI
ncbi:hypothetical protein MICA_1778 [Micavibrio aeruginosavorus ARL-13]|uniref:Uncharacterized protein n=2 Tax=Micavibrio aeruginosavorus TaxID=349221 RepID=G2KSU5_MICAA|nr:hypothetical protein MICA_1778 [Micavibrio aeruginosavorus ARL-13]